MPRNDVSPIVGIVFVVVVLLLVGSCERAKWNECRRVHPGWYCFTQMGK